MTVLKSALSELYTPIGKDLEAFSACFKRELSSSDTLISDIHGHILKMTGKFLRPALVLLTAKTKEQEIRTDVLKLAAAVELIHTATLVHDDIIDGSEMRRSLPSVYSKWGKDISIVAGDYLYTKAFLLLAGFNDPWIMQTFASCAKVICEGEMKQIEKRNDFLMSEEVYFQIIYQKTAALFQAACKGGAYLSKSSPEAVEKLGNFGFNLGMAFQIVDDCLDLIGETETLGKTAGLDIYKNDVTLPLLYLFKALPPSEANILWSEIQERGPSVVKKIKNLVLEKDCIQNAMIKARDYATKAASELEELSDSASKESLLQLTHYCVERVN